MENAFDNIKTGLEEAIEYAKGKKHKKTRIHKISVSKNNPNGHSGWVSAVDDLFQKTQGTISSTNGPFALTAGMALGKGYVVLVENDDVYSDQGPVQLHVIRVEGGPYRGEIKVIESDNPFDEKLTLRLSIGGTWTATRHVERAWQLIRQYAEE